MNEFEKGLFAEPYVHYASFNAGYIKAIDDFVTACKENVLFKTFGLRGIDIIAIAQVLKERVENE